MKLIIIHYLEKFDLGRYHLECLQYYTPLTPCMPQLDQFQFEWLAQSERNVC